MYLKMNKEKKKNQSNIKNIKKIVSLECLLWKFYALIVYEINKQILNFENKKIDINLFI